MELYVPTYEGSKEYQEVGEYKILMPKRPKARDMVNYGVSDHKQYFKRQEYPDGFLERTLTLSQEREVVKMLNHKRRHGEWQLIRGEPYYIPGNYWWIVNYWTPEYVDTMEFRYWQLRVMWWANMIIRDPNLFGGYLVKSRRCGASEIFLAEGTEHATRKRKSWFGMQNQSDDDAKADFKRVVRGVNGLLPIWRPVNKGNAAPEEAFEFTNDSGRMSKSKLEELYARTRMDDEDKYLESRIDYAATVLGKYDGKRTTRYRGGEIGKIPPNQMDVWQQWLIVKKTLAVHSEMSIRGKAFFETTLEEKEKKNNGGDIDPLPINTKFWNTSDPNNLDDNGRTVSGLARLALLAQDTAEPDEFGFPKSEELLRFLENKFKKIEESGDKATLAAEQRRDPIKLEHIFLPANDSAQFSVEALTRVKNNILKELDHRGEPVDVLGNTVRKRAVRGNLYRMSDGKVGFHADEKGKWLISQHPTKPNSIINYRGVDVPGAVDTHVMGIDPINSGSNHQDQKRSKGAIAVYRKTDRLVDAKKVDNTGEKVPYLFETGKFVCIYLHRPADVYEFYEDALMTAEYYSCEALIERPTLGITEYWKKKHAHMYAMHPFGRYANRSNRREPGLPTTGDIIDHYISLLKHFVYDRVDTIDFIPLIDQLMEFRQGMQTLFDLIPAAGYALIASEKNYNEVIVGQQQEEETAEKLVRTYRRYG